MKVEAEPCIRRRVEIDGDHYYILVGHRFVAASVPYENRPENLKQRQVIESLCAAITNCMEKLQGEEKTDGD